MESKRSLPVVVYTAESSLRNPKQLLKGMVKDLLASRELGWRLLVRNISVRYRQSLLGPVWTFMPPVATAIAFTLLRSSGVIEIGDTQVPYPFYVVVGVVLWQLFTNSLNLPLKAMKSAQTLIKTIKMPIEAIILSSVGELLFDQAINFSIMVLLLFFFKIPLTFGILLMPFAIVLLMSLGLGLGLLLVPVGSLYTDIPSAIPIITQFWFFLTPVIYTPPDRFPYSLLINLNPVSPLLVGARSLLSQGTLGGDPAPFFIVSGLSMLLLLFGWVLYRLSIPILIER
jgi:lipopolysaccharide transport system permease protein